MCHLCSELQIVSSAMLAIDIIDKPAILRAIKKHKRVLEYGQIICDELAPTLVIQQIGMSIGICFTAISVLYVSFFSTSHQENEFFFLRSHLSDEKSSNSYKILEHRFDTCF